MNTITNTLGSLIFLSSCESCGRCGEKLCEKCARDLAEPRNEHCPLCGQTSVFPRACPCNVKNIPITSLFSYNKTIRTLIHGAKYRNIKEALQPLFYNLTSTQIQTLSYLSQREGLQIVPLPLHQKKHTERGYNVAEYTAQEVGKLIQKEVVQLLYRHIHTAPQAQLKHAAERRENLRGAFMLLTPHHHPKKPILLIDDLVTSGATLYEATKTLQKEGSTEIYALCLAQERFF